jgi:hypothetical protein
LLPEDFKNIPEDSPKENVLASVPDTPEAEEPVIANLIPETVDVKRSEPKMTDPLFDGEPTLAQIQGTSLQYVIKTPTPMVRTADGYWAVDNGARYTAASSKGPWRRAEKIPRRSTASLRTRLSTLRHLREGVWLERRYSDGRQYARLLRSRRHHRIGRGDRVRFGLPV